MAENRIRMTLDLSASLNQQLDQLAEKTGLAKADLLRVGLDYLLRADKAIDEGMTVGAWKDDEKRGLRQEREFVGPLGPHP